MNQAKVLFLLRAPASLPPCPGPHHLLKAAHLSLWAARPFCGVFLLGHRPAQLSGSSPVLLAPTGQGVVGGSGGWKLSAGFALLLSSQTLAGLTSTGLHQDPSPTPPPQPHSRGLFRS